MPYRPSNFLVCFFSYLLLSAHPIEAKRMQVASGVHVSAGIASGSEGPFNGFFGGNEVCKEDLFSTPQVSVERFEYKLNKLKVLLKDVIEEPSRAKVSEARRRALRFQECFNYAKTDAMPAELKALIRSDSEGSLKHTMRTMKLAVVQKMKGHGMFPNGGKCGFNPEKVSITLAAAGDNPESLLSKQLFGEGCEAVPVVNYMQDRTDLEHKVIDLESVLSAEELKAKLGNLTADEAESVRERFDQAADAIFDNFEENGSSLMQMDSDAAFIGEIIFLLVVVAVMILTLSEGMNSGEF